MILLLESNIYKLKPYSVPHVGEMKQEVIKGGLEQVGQSSGDH